LPPAVAARINPTQERQAMRRRTPFRSLACYSVGEDGKPVAPSEAAIEAGLERAFIRLEEVIRAAGADWSDVVEKTSHTRFQ
jgi:hypothetical protein